MYKNACLSIFMLCGRTKSESEVLECDDVIHHCGALAREARSGAPWVIKCGKLPIRENLVIT